MKGLWRRFRFYLFGFLMGSILVGVIFQGRACAWTPSNRVKKDINDKAIVIPENQIEALQAMGLNENNIHKFMLQNSVDFKTSLKDLDQYPKVYVVENKDVAEQRVSFSIYEDSYITVVHALGKEKPQRYEELEGMGKLATLPRDSAIVHIDTDNHTQCKATKLPTKNPHKIVAGIKKSGRINFSKSNLMSTKATQHLSFILADSIPVEALTIWYKERITFKDFEWEEKLPCEE